MLSRTSPQTLVLDEVLDASTVAAVLRFRKNTRKTSSSNASIDLRRTRAIASGAWATLVYAIRDLNLHGHKVTVLAHKRLHSLLEITELVRHARIVIVGRVRSTAA